MVALPTDQRAVIADYLAKNFPEKPRPAAVVIPGDVKVTIKEWVVPTLGSRPHDPLADADGAIWWTGHVRQRAGPARSEDRRDEGVPAEDAAVRSARPDGRQGRQHLVHRRTPRARRQARIRRRARSPSTRCPTRPRAIRTRRSSTRTARSGSRCRAATWSARLIPKTGEIKLVTCRRRDRNPVRHGRQLARACRSSCEFGANKRRQHRSEDDGDQGVHAAERRDAAAAHRDHERRRASGTRTTRAAIWAGSIRRPARSRSGRRRAGRSRSRTASRRSNDVDLVQRIGGQAEHARALRSEDREVPDVGDSRRAAASCAT